MFSFDPEFHPLTNEELSHIDAISEEFEAAISCGMTRSIEEILDQNPNLPREPLLLELLRIETELHREWDVSIDPKKYYGRFPELVRFESDSAVQFRADLEETCKASSRTHRQEVLVQHDTDQSKNSDVPLTQQPYDDVSKQGGELSQSTTRFTISRRLATGGIGTVYVASDRQLGREVAVKVLKRRFLNDLAIFARFQNEASITSHLEHPNIVPIYAAGYRTDGLPYFAMRLIKGINLQALIERVHLEHRSRGAKLDFRNTVACRDLLNCLITISRSIAYAHSKGIVHQDLKPSNIMVGDFGESLIVDWGLARSTLNSKSETKNRRQDVVGTPGFMSPEQSTTQSDEVDHRSDIYALGATLATILTGQPPKKVFLTGSATQVYVKSSSQSDTFSIRSTHHLPPGLISIVRKATHESPDLRYQSAVDFAEDLERWLSDKSISCHSDSAYIRLRRWSNQHPRTTWGVFATIFCAALSLAIGVTVLSYKNQELADSNARERQATRIAGEQKNKAEEKANEVVSQRKQILALIDQFLLDVQRGIANIPGGERVQRNILQTTLQQLAKLSTEFESQSELGLSNSIALLDLAKLFIHFGSMEIQIDTLSNDESSVAPLDFALHCLDRAYAIADSLDLREELLLIQTKADILETAGDVHFQKGALKTAESTLVQALGLRDEVFNSSFMPMESAVAYIGTLDMIGKVQSTTGDSVSAERTIEMAHSLAKELSSRYPDSRIVQRTVSISHSRKGDLAVKHNDLDLASYHYEEDARITKEIYESQKEDAVTARDYCVAMDRLGKILELRGKLDDALTYYEASRLIREEKSESSPLDMRLLREAFVSNFKIGEVLMVLNRHAESKDRYTYANSIAEKLTSMDETSVVARRYQSMCNEAMCDILISESNPQQALAFANKSLEIARQLSLRVPEDVNMQRDLFVSMTKVAKVHRLMKNYDLGVRTLHEALQVGIEIDRIELGAGILGACTPSIHVRLGEIFLEAGDSLQAILNLEKMIAIETAHPIEKRSDATAMRRLMNGYMLLGRSYLAQKETSKAIDALKIAKQIVTELIQQKSRLERSQIDLQEIELILEQANQQDTEPK